jgi:MFS family permease
MDVNTFYALFSATCFTLLGLWWGVVQRHEEWMRDPRLRGIVGGVYVSFLLPALMGLFAQVGGTESPAFWRVSFVVVAVIGVISTLRLLRSQREAPVLRGPLMRNRWAVAVVYGLVAVVGAAPEIVTPLGVRPIQAEAVLLILLIVMAHGLVWEFMISAARQGAQETQGTQDAAPPRDATP